MLRLIATVFAALLVASCAGVDASPRPSISAVHLRVDELPKATLVPTITLICDPDPSQSDADAGESTIPCQEGAVLALRALTMGGGSAPDRLYLRRQTCAATPCTQDELNTAIVSGWSDGHAVTLAIDPRSTFVVAAADDPAAAWPPSKSSARPTAAPIAIKDAPAEVTGRESLPSCGSIDEPGPLTDAAVGFRDAVARAQPAELLVNVVSVEGDPLRWLLSFTGDGAITRYRTDESGAWHSEHGGLILHPGDAGGFSYDPWPETQVQLE